MQPKAAHPDDQRPLDHPYFARGPRHVGYLLVAAVATLPLLIPSGPGNSALADVGILAFVASVFAWLWHERARVTLPYLVPVALLVTAGAVSALHGGTESAVLTIAQDIFCLLWAAAIANAVRRRRWLLELLLRAWVWSGVAWAGVLCVGRIAGISWMAGITARDGGRASLTFDDPNLAANYFLVCVGLILATSVVRHLVTRVLVLGVVLLAMVFTGSNGGAIGLVTLVVVGMLGGLQRRRGTMAAASAALLVTVAVAVVAPHVNIDQIGQQASDSIQILKDSLGRTDESSGSRQVLASETLHLYLEGDLVGVGPGQTKAVLKGQAAPYVKEAHNDYLATLVERGALGGLGLVALIAVIALRLGRTATWPQSVWVRHLVPRPEFLLALGCALAAAALFYEVLHFRHVWAFLGLVAGIDPGVAPFGDRRWRRTG
ncbi:hypothetical protein GCM10027053_26550 [Intrasporangium mesophilum]